MIQKIDVGTRQKAIKKTQRCRFCRFPKKFKPFEARTWNV